MPSHMGQESLRSTLWPDAHVGHFVAMLLMGPVAATAIVLMQQLGFAARTSLWVVPTIVVCGQACTTAADFWWERSPTKVRMHTRIGAQALLVGAVVYAIGWGPALAVGFVLVGQNCADRVSLRHEQRRNRLAMARSATG
jgi:hypothetical protein